jgi:hypothetical protein
MEDGGGGDERTDGRRTDGKVACRKVTGDRAREAERLVSLVE